MILQSEFNFLFSVKMQNLVKLGLEENGESLFLWINER